MIRFSCILGVLLVSRSTSAQSTSDWSREDRVVLSSPHFDIMPRPFGLLNCPTQPMRLYGFEHAGDQSAAPLLAIRLSRHRTEQGDPQMEPLPDTYVRLSSRWDGSTFVSLPPTPDWVVRSDSLGVVRLQAPSGVYEFRVLVGQPVGTGVIRIRPGSRDSLHVHIELGRLC